MGRHACVFVHHPFEACLRVGVHFAKLQCRVQSPAAAVVQVAHDALLVGAIPRVVGVVSCVRRACARAPKRTAAGTCVHDEAVSVLAETSLSARALGRDDVHISVGAHVAQLHVSTLAERALHANSVLEGLCHSWLRKESSDVVAECGDGGVIRDV